MAARAACGTAAGRRAGWRVRCTDWNGQCRKRKRHGGRGRLRGPFCDRPSLERAMVRQATSAHAPVSARGTRRSAEPSRALQSPISSTFGMVSLVGGEAVELQLLCLLLKEGSRLRAPSAADKLIMRAVNLHVLLWSANLTRCRKDGIGSFRQPIRDNFNLYLHAYPLSFGQGTVPATGARRPQILDAASQSFWVKAALSRASRTRRSGAPPVR
ncbi:hypothetical protein IQ07DRAFT_651884 [Pyrenochaeta sp. DS3sAY3a]|nr:hypothetical protein IQ07DRAFT_651884 [Pyrenochaeta sp. DS3sAY3a]